MGDAEIDSFLEEQKASPTGNVEYNLRHVLVRVPEQATPVDWVLVANASRARCFVRDADNGVNEMPVVSISVVTRPAASASIRRASSGVATSSESSLLRPRER